MYKAKDHIDQHILQYLVLNITYTSFFVLLNQKKDHLPLSLIVSYYNEHIT